MFDLVSAPFLIAAGLLVVAGVAKLRQPHGALRVLEALRLPARTTGVRLLGLVEVAVGAAAFASGARWSALVLASMFGLFALVGLWLVVARVDVPSCGCLGALDTPPSLLHVVLCVLAGAAAVLAALADPVRIDHYLGSLPAAGVPFLIAVAAGVAAAVLAMAYVPILAASYTPDHRG